MSQYGGQRRADDRRSTYTQKLANPVDDRRTTYTLKKKSINGEDEDDRRSIATTRGLQKPSLAVISTHRLEWINLARYLELELKDFGVQLPKDAQMATVLDHHYRVMLPVKLTKDQVQTIDMLRFTSDTTQADIDELLRTFEDEKQLGDVREDNED